MKRLSSCVGFRWSWSWEPRLWIPRTFSASQVQCSGLTFNQRPCIIGQSRFEVSPHMTTLCFSPPQNGWLPVGENKQILLPVMWVPPHIGGPKGVTPPKNLKIRVLAPQSQSAMLAMFERPKQAVPKPLLVLPSLKIRPWHPVLPNKRNPT